MTTQSALNALKPEQCLIAQQLVGSFQMNAMHNHPAAQLQMLMQQHLNSSVAALAQSAPTSMHSNNSKKQPSKPLNHSSQQQQQQSMTSINETSALIKRLVNSSQNTSGEHIIPLPPFASLYSSSTKQCQWPDCHSTQHGNVAFDSFDSYLQSHLNAGHKLDDKSHLDLIKQSNLIDKLEFELRKQKQILNDMLAHLNNQLNAFKHQQLQQQQQLFQQQQQQQQNQLTALVSNGVSNPLFLTAIASAAAAASASKNNHNATSAHTNEQNLPTNIKDDSLVDSSSADAFMRIQRRPFERSSLSLAVELQRNRDLYRTQDIRPSFTYASLIRQSIAESDEHQLTLNEIYKWFEANFSYFRKNGQKWKVC